MASIAALIDETLEALEGIYHVERNVLLTNQGTTGTFTFAMDNSGIDAGVIVEIESELQFVQSILSTTATPIRGFMGTAAVAHLSGTIIKVSPRFSRRRVSHAMRDEVRSLPQSLFTPALEQVSITSSQRVIRLQRSDVYRLLEVRRDPRPSTGSDFFLASAVSRDTFPALAGARLMRAGPAADAGWGVEIAGNVPDGSLYVLYAAPFDTSVWNEDVDLVDEVGLADSMQDIVKWGVMSRLIGEEEALRVDLGEQGQPRIATEVAQAEIPQASNFYLQLRNRRINEEAGRLLQLYPLRGW